MYNKVDLISENYEDVATGKLQIRRSQQPVSLSDSIILYEKSLRTSTNNSYYQKEDSLTYISAADSMSLFLHWLPIRQRVDFKLSVTRCWCLIV